MPHAAQTNTSIKSLLNFFTGKSSENFPCLDAAPHGSHRKSREPKEDHYSTFSSYSSSRARYYSACCSSSPSSRRLLRLAIAAALLRHFPSYRFRRHILPDLLARADAAPTAPPLRSARLCERSSLASPEIRRRRIGISAPRRRGSIARLAPARCPAYNILPDCHSIRGASQLG